MTQGLRDFVFSRKDPGGRCTGWGTARVPMHTTRGFKLRAMWLFPGAFVWHWNPPESPRVGLPGVTGAGEELLPLLHLPRRLESVRQAQGLALLPSSLPPPLCHSSMGFLGTFPGDTAGRVCLSQGWLLGAQPRCRRPFCGACVFIFAVLLSSVCAVSSVRSQDNRQKDLHQLSSVFPTVYRMV